jgi:thiamine-phosphate pyrophosphorylase
MLMLDALSRAKLARAARSLNLNARLRRSGLNAGGLILMTDDLRLPDPFAAARALPPGSLLILRARDAARRAQLAKTLLPLVRQRGLIFLIADDAKLARAVGVHGLHLPEARARQAAHWRAKNPGWLITASAHSLRAVLAARGADAVLLSPVFATQSHDEARPLSPARARLIARNIPVPLFALGGVTAQNAALLSGFSGLAAIGPLNPKFSD